MSKGKTTEISSLKDLEKEFTTIKKIFVGKETELNWNERDSSLRRLHAVINSEHVHDWKDSLLQGLHDIIPKIIVSIHSLRTSVALEGLGLMEDVCIRLGEQLDIYTLEIILQNLLKSSSVTKKFVATKTSQVTHQFLSHTLFHSKILILLCKTMNEKNIQLRQFSAAYISTLLSTHGSKESVKAHIEKSMDMLEEFLKKGLTDASPLVRDGCRQTFSAYRHVWPEQAERLSLSFDKSIQRQLDKISPSSSTQLTKSSSQPSLLTRSSSQTSRSSPGLLTRSSSQTSRTSIQPSSQTSRTSIQPSSQTSRTSIQPSSQTSRTSIQPSKPRPSSQPTKSTSLPRLSQPIARSLTQPIPRPSSQPIPRPSSQPIPRPSSQPIPRPSSQPTLSQKRPSSPPNRPTKRPHLKRPAQPLLQLLQSPAEHDRLEGLKRLADKVRQQPYGTLPPDVPTKLELAPILTQLLTDQTELEPLHDCLGLLSMNYYIPTLILRRPAGLDRLKGFLKANEPDLAYRLLDLANQLMHTEQVGELEVLDATVRTEILMGRERKLDLQCGLLEWMDELVRDWMGEGSLASRWFDEAEHLRSFVQFVIQYLLEQETKPNEMFPILSGLASHLKAADEKIFESELQDLERDGVEYVQRALGLGQFFRDDDLQPSLDSLVLDEEDQAGCLEDESFHFLSEDEDELDEKVLETGMTQDISSLFIKNSTTL